MQKQTTARPGVQALLWIRHATRDKYKYAPAL